MPAPKGNKFAKGNAGGRPSKFEASFCELAKKACLLGATNDDLAKFFDVSPSSIDQWIADHKEFSSAVKEGREVADAEVASKLFHRATGYSHSEVHVSAYQGEVILTPLVKHYPPDATSAIFWLKNRQRDKWRDKTDHELTGKDGTPLMPEPIDIARRIAFALSAGAVQLDK